MRKPEYLSPTSVRSYFENPEEFYIRYLADAKVPRPKQTQAMSIGSAFDAYVKSYMYEAIFGKGHDPRFDRDTIFESQVESHNRDWAKIHGQHAFEVYKSLGSLADLMIELNGAVGKPRFEIEIRGVVEGQRDGKKMIIKGIPLLGKPDVFYINKEGRSVILDWKINGWCSASPVSPMPGYINLRGDLKKTGPHKNAVLGLFQGQTINTAMYLEQGDEDWAAQLATYGWLCGEEVGDEFITAIDQFACGPSGSDYPKIRVAEHRLRVSTAFQWQVFSQYQIVADVVAGGLLFPGLTVEQNQAKMTMLNGKAKMLKDMAESNDPMEKEFRKACGMDRPW